MKVKKTDPANNELMKEYLSVDNGLINEYLEQHTLDKYFLQGCMLL